MTVKNLIFLKIFGSVCLLFFFCFGFCCSSSFAEDLAWPEITHQTKPWTRWWWMGSIVTEKDLTAEMEKYVKAGIGGLEITPIYGVKGYEDQFITYFSPKWMDMLGHVLKEAERLGMGVDLATGNGWPFGGPWVGAADASKNMVHQTYVLKGGERLVEPVVHIQEPMVRAAGRRLDISEVKEPIRENEDLQGLALEQVRFEKPLPLQVLMAYSGQGEILDLTERVDAEGRLDWTATEGNWVLYAVFQGWHGKMVERAGPGGEGNVIDHFSQDVLNRYLNRFDQAFAGRDIGGLRAFFNDSYEVDDARGESNWTPAFFDAFEQRRGYDLRHSLPVLFAEEADEKTLRVLCDFRETLSDLLLEQFTIPWGAWAENKGAITRNQAHGSPANILDLYAASGIPETEGREVLRFKFASSAANVTGKPLVSAEASTWLEEHFQGSLADVKQNLDQYFLGGINHICYHGTTFSPQDEAWPGWLFYASVHFGPTNAFWPDFGALNQYAARCQSFLQSGRSDNDLLLYFPIYDRWSQGRSRRGMLPHFDGSARGTVIRETGEHLLNTGYAFDFVSDRQLKNVAFAGTELQAGGVDYRAVLVPECQYMPLETFQKLVGLARKGATVIIQGHLPSDVPGWGNLDERRKGFRELIDQLDFAATGNVQRADIGEGRFLLGNDLDTLLSYAGIRREAMVDRGLRFGRRRHENGRFYFVVNMGDQPVNGWVSLQTAAKSVGLFDPMLGGSGLAEFRETDSDVSEVYLQLEPGASCILKTWEREATAAPYRYWRTEGESQAVEGVWSVRFVAGGPELPSDVETQNLVSWTTFEGEAVKAFSGTARYAISFEKPEGEADGWMLDLGGVHESARIRLNGKDLVTLIHSPFQVLIPKALMEEKNTLEVLVSNLMANRIADLDRQGADWRKFYNINFPARRRENRGADRLFNASQWLPMDSGLVGPVMLTPIAFMTFD